MGALILLALVVGSIALVNVLRWRGRVRDLNQPMGRDRPLYLGWESRERAASAFDNLGGDARAFLSGWDMAADMGGLCPWPGGSFGAYCWSQGWYAFNRNARFGWSLNGRGEYHDSEEYESP